MSYYLNGKMRDVFPDESIFKKAGGYSYFSGVNIPSFIKDWIVKKYSNTNGMIAVESIIQFLDQHLPGKDSNIKGKLIRGEVLTILARILIEIDIRSGKFKFGLPDLGIKTSEGEISNSVIDNHSKDLFEGETWGIIKIQYRSGDDFSFSSKGYIEMISFQPFKPYKPDVDYFREARKMFSLEEWVDVLISCMEYNPECDNFDTFDKKLLFLSRLLVFVEPNLNLVELAPKGTGKSYIFNNLSKYGWQISGGKITRAKLFYNMSTQSPGLITNYEFIAMDEIKTITFDNQTELQGALKNYLESGNFTVGKSRQTSTCGFILLGNISLNSQLLPDNQKYFMELPEVFHDTALLDRFHGFIEGWKLPRLTQNSFFEGYALNVEYFSEVLSIMRTMPEYMNVVNLLLEIPKNADVRDVKAISRLCAGYMKLLFPHVRSINDILPLDFYNYCFLPAYEKRRIIRQQISLMDPEFKRNLPDIRVKGVYE